MNRYSYKIVGIDTNWQSPGTNNTIKLDNLAMGSYKILVSTSNSEMSRHKNPIEVEISIRPHFYETNWYILFTAVIIATITFFITRSYFARTDKRIKAQFEEIINKQDSNTKNQPSTLKVSEVKCAEIVEKLDDYMKSQKPYLNPNLKQSVVASTLNYPVHEISQVLNIYLQLNFPDYINSFRVEELKECIAKGRYVNYNVTAIAEKCGFNSKTTFYRAFKKATGLSPVDYFKNHVCKFPKTT